MSQWPDQADRAAAEQAARKQLIRQNRRNPIAATVATAIGLLGVAAYPYWRLLSIAEPMIRDTFQQARFPTRDTNPAIMWVIILPTLYFIRRSLLLSARKLENDGKVWRQLTWLRRSDIIGRAVLSAFWSPAGLLVIAYLSAAFAAAHGTPPPPPMGPYYSPPALPQT